MDKETGEALLGDDGLPKVGTTIFTPESADGTIDVVVNHGHNGPRWQVGRLLRETN